ncbi:hypothetical protein, partial [Desulfonatronospira sp.]|uniref:hypothetical protein n=1 Tax=Desulfonatronospira sp. TaxID=1962951 RepID=UPI0025BC63A2
LRGLALLPPDFLFNCKLSNGKSACPQLRQVINFRSFAVVLSIIQKSAQEPVPGVNKLSLAAVLFTLA